MASGARLGETARLAKSVRRAFANGAPNQRELAGEKERERGRARPRGRAGRLQGERKRDFPSPMDAADALDLSSYQGDIRTNSLRLANTLEVHARGGK